MRRPLGARAESVLHDLIGKLNFRAKQALEKDLALHATSADQLARRRIAPSLRIPRTGGSRIDVSGARSRRMRSSRQSHQVPISTFGGLPSINSPSPSRRRSLRGHVPLVAAPKSSARDFSARQFSTSALTLAATSKSLKSRSKAVKSPLDMEQSGATKVRIHPSHRPPRPARDGSVKSKGSNSPAASEVDLASVSKDMEAARHNRPNPATARQSPPHMQLSTRGPGRVVAEGEFSAKEINLETLDDGRNAPVAILRRNLQKIPFNPGVHTMRDPRTGVWNFDPDQLHEIPTPEQFAFNRTPAYFPPGKDMDLLRMAQESKSTYLGSTSTLTKAFSQIYFALSGNRPVDLTYLSLPFITERNTFTPGACLPACLEIGKGENGTIFVDNDSKWDSENVLTQYGVILEKMLTTEPDDFKRFLTAAPDEGVSQAEREDRGAFAYQKGNKLLMRSQLDCWDPRLPGTGVFDIKTRACLTVRHDRANWEAMSKYDIYEERGMLESFEREYFDLIRSAMLKYSMQARIGLMDGIFLAYHNTARNIGYQYISLDEMDKRLFGSSEMGESAFRLIVALFETLLDEIVQCFPDERVSVTIKQAPPSSSRMVAVYVQPSNWDGPEDQRPIQAITLCIRNSIDGEDQSGAIGFSVDEELRKSQDWKVKWTMTKTNMEPSTQKTVRRHLDTARKELSDVMWLAIPEGKTMDQMDKAQKELELANPDIIYATRWKNPDNRAKELRKLAAESGKRYDEKVAAWGKEMRNSWEYIQR